METEFFYSTVTGNSAVMRIHGDIGYDVIGTVFAAELAALEALGVTDITVRILSGGGNVIDGFAIFSALLNSKAVITTVNEGIAASTAGWIFLAGKSAIMCDYALLMLHNPSSPDQSAKGLERVDFMRNSIITIISKRTGTDLKTLGKMMDTETWMDADKALELGFATAIEETELLADLNPNAQTVNQMYSICNSIIIKNEISEMTTIENTTTDEVTPEVKPEEVTPVAETVTNEVTPEAIATEAEAQVVNEDDDVVATVTEAEKINALVEAGNPVAEEAPAEESDLVKVNAELMAEIAALKTTVNAYKEAEELKVTQAREAKSLELVTNAITLGKIAGTAKSSWLEIANANYDTAKLTLDAIMVTKSGTDIMNKVANTSTVAPGKKLRELEKENPKEVARLIREDRGVYNQLYFEQYGKYPA